MNGFVIVPTLALGFYLFLLVVFVVSKKTELRRPLLGLLVMDVLWAFGSVCMRLNMEPSYKFWFYVSLFGIYMLPTAMLNFTLQYTGWKLPRIFRILMMGTFVLFWVNVLVEGLFIAPPEMVETELGFKFVYTTSGFLETLPYAYLAGVMAYTGYILIRALKDKKLDTREFVLLLSGKVLLVLGNVLINVPPFKGFPIDMFSGLLDAILLASLLGTSERFKQSMTVSNQLYEILILISLAIPMLCVLEPYEHFLMRMIGDHPNYETYRSLIVTVTYLVVLILLYGLNLFLTDKVFRKDREIRIEKLNEFSSKSCQTLDLGQIYEMIQDTAQVVMDTDWVGLCVWDRETCMYVCNRELPDSSGRKVHLLADSALVRYAQAEGKAIDVVAMAHQKEIEWELCGQLALMDERNIAMIQPIYSENKLHALLLIAHRQKRYTMEEERYLASLASVSAVAIKNAETYSSAYWEARKDEMTGIWNRKYFYEMLKVYGKSEELSLALLKLDDFRIYNQLYGNDEGDRILRKVAVMIRDTVGKEGIVFRYAATEFAILLKDYDAYSAQALMESIRLAVMGVDSLKKQRQMMITVSCGVYELAEGETAGEEMVRKCTMALFLAKKNGKNCTMVYRDGLETNAENVAYFKKGIFSEYEPVFRALTAAIDAKDHYTFSHSQNVAYYAAELARACQLSGESIEIAKEAGLLHDIGKLGIPESILQKPGKLTNEESNIMKGHVNQSISILRHLSGMEYVLPVILGHHERYDGTGYPKGDAGEKIPMLGRILCIADSFDAMISKRPYKTGYSLEYAVNQLESGKGTQFDPKLVDKFIQLLKEKKLQIRYNDTVLEEKKG